MSTPDLVIAGTALITFAIKAAGPVMSGGRELPVAVREVFALLAPALLTALMVVEALADGDRLTADAQTGGVAVAGLVYWRTKSIVWCVVAAGVVTAGLRAA